MHINSLDKTTHSSEFAKRNGIDTSLVPQKIKNIAQSIMNCFRELSRSIHQPLKIGQITFENGVATIKFEKWIKVTLTTTVIVLIALGLLVTGTYIMNVAYETKGLENAEKLREHDGRTLYQLLEKNCGNPKDLRAYKREVDVLLCRNPQMHELTKHSYDRCFKDLLDPKPAIAS